MAGAAGDVTLTAFNADDLEIGSVSFTVLDDAVLTSIVGVRDLTTYVSPEVTSSIGVDNLIINDQYGREFKLTGTEGAIVSFESDTDALTLDTNQISADGTLTADITGTLIAGTATVVIDLVADIDNPVVLDSYTVDFTNVTGIAAGDATISFVLDNGNDAGSVLVTVPDVV